jgi:6-phosphogluconolactonase
MSHLNSTLLLLLSFLLLIPILGFSQTQKEMIYVGTFTERGSQGIYVFELERATGKLTQVQTIVDRESPNYLDFHPNEEYLYAVNRQGTADKLDQGSVSTFRIDQNTGKLALIGTISSGGVGPCHVSVDPKGRLIYISHYASSHMTVFALDKNGKIGELVYSMQFVGSSINPDRQKESHLHSIVPSQDGRFFYASDMGTDLIHQFSIRGKFGNMKVNHADTLHVKPGSGPRHFTMHPSAKFALSVEELTSTVALYAVSSRTGELEFKEREK